MKKKSASTLKNVIIILLVAAILWLILRHSRPETVNNNITEPAGKTDTSAPAPTTITKKDIKEENFSGSEPVITGSSAAAIAAQAYVDQSVADFKKQADTDVPDMRAKFGADSPPASYTIDIDAKDLKGPKTESIVVSSYVYTGGANGNELYKVFTQDTVTGKIISLSDVIAADKQAAFTAEVKKELIAWQPEGTTAPVVFPDDVNALTFSSFTDWSLDGQNLTLYFDKYAIGPGVLGPVAFPVPLSKIQTDLK